MTGMVLAYFIYDAIRKRKFIFHTPQPGSWEDKLIRVWGFELIEDHPRTSLIPEPDQNLDGANETLVNMNGPNNRGRRPIYSIDQWEPVVLKWENHDSFRDTRTLTKYLGDEFGTNADGSPKMSEQSFYDWRKRVHAELKKKQRQ